MKISSLAVRTISPLDRPRAFTPADKSLIRKVHGLMPAQQLLEVLNDRLVGDRGQDANKYTMEQLYAEIGGAGAATPDEAGQDWHSLRKLLAKARREGVLGKVSRQVIDDFAVVFSLSSGQVLRLQDVLLLAQEGDEQ